MWKFNGKVQFPHSFGRIARSFAETVPFHKFSYRKIRRNYCTLHSVCSEEVPKNFGKLKERRHLINVFQIKLQAVRLQHH